MIPYAWNQAKASTLRSCFASTPVLPEEMSKQVKAIPTIDVERQHGLRYTWKGLFDVEERAYFKHLVATIDNGNRWHIDDIPEVDALDRLEKEPSITDDDADDNSGEGISQLPEENNHGSTHSSPLSKETYRTSIDMLLSLSDGQGLGTPEGLKTIMDNTGDLSNGRVVRGLMKRLFRACSDASRDTAESPTDTSNDQERPE